MPGGANGRALAAILNDLRVRDLLAARGIAIPADTVFLGGLHNTAVDALTFFDLELLPKSRIPDFESARETLAEVCERNAHERCRRFDSAPLNLSFEAAHRHVEDRSEDLAPNSGMPRMRSALSGGGSAPAGCTSTAARFWLRMIQRRTTPNRQSWPGFSPPRFPCARE